MILSPHNTLSVISKSGSPPTKPLSAIRSNTSPLRILADKTNGGDKENTCQEPTTRLQKRLRIPSVYLDTESISCAMAARLASSLIGHVLFQKGQIPLCVSFYIYNDIFLTRLDKFMSMCFNARINS